MDRPWWTYFDGPPTRNHKACRSSKIILVEIIERRIGIQGSVMKGNILRAGLVLITIVTVCIITDFSTIMVLIGATCCSLLGKCLIITSPAIQVKKFPRTADQTVHWPTCSGPWIPAYSCPIVFI